MPEDKYTDDQLRFYIKDYYDRVKNDPKCLTNGLYIKRIKMLKKELRKRKIKLLK
jgi:hypothetical protein